MAGTPGAFARDIVRVDDEEIKINYNSTRSICQYSGKCPDCGTWHNASTKKQARETAEMCCHGV